MMLSKQMCLTSRSGLLYADMALQSDVLPAPGRPQVKARQTLARCAWSLHGFKIIHSESRFTGPVSGNAGDVFGLFADWADFGQTLASSIK